MSRRGLVIEKPGGRVVGGGTITDGSTVVISTKHVTPKVTADALC